MKTMNSQLTDTRAFLQRTLKGGSAIAGEQVRSLNRPGSGLPANNWSASKGSSEKKPLFQRESPKVRVQPTKNQAPSIQALK